MTIADTLGVKLDLRKENTRCEAIQLKVELFVGEMQWK
jgi:hypothetical protein